ncbi:MAG TPA: ABC transporter ATP-binding protein [Gemmatimonadales bacterium]|nr:ABC transporter ATP-binding protein [Gemmatimonadales bacterium]
MPSRAARLLGFVRPYRTAVAAGASLSLVASVLDGLSFALLIPFLRLLFGIDTPEAPGSGRLERWLDHALGGLFDPGDPAAALRNLVLLIVSVVAVKNAALYAAGLLRVRAQEGVARDLRLALHSHLQRLGLDFFTRTRGGQIATRLTSDPDQAKLVIGQVLWSVAQSGTVVLVYVALLFAISARLTLITLVIAPAIAALLHPLLTRVRVRLRDVAHERGELTALAVETAEAARAVKAHGGAGAEQERAARTTRRYGDSIMRVERLSLLAHPVSETLGAAAVLAIVTTGSVTALAGSLRPEALIAFLAVTLRLLPPVKALSHVPALAEQALVAAERVFDLLDRAPTDVDPPGSPDFPGFQREIELRHAWVAHDPERWVLRDINLRIQRGEIVAIVGPSGAGKSTLLDLLPRFVEPARGDVLIDGVSVRRYDRRSLRRALGIVSQHTVLFHDSVMHNIAYGDRAGASREEVEAAARAANAHEFILRLPQGYDTVLGERGLRLSGGERQRVAIARALLRDPEILLLDEATSSLDAESERLIHDAIRRLAGGRTVLVVAHRASTVAYADRVLRLERGRLVEPDAARAPRAARESVA